MKPFDGKRILITGGTGSLGKTLVNRLMTGEMGTPACVLVFSRDEAKQHFMRVEWQQKVAATHELIYRDCQQRLEFRIGDVRDFHSVAAVLREADIVFNAAAMKQVPACEYAPWECVKTNVLGAENIVRAIQEYKLPVETVVGISTDKACKPVNVMGMSKAIQERVFIQANLRCPNTRFICVRYGNVLASRGSVIPLFHGQISNGGPVTLTSPEMTRFLLTLDDAVDTVFAAYKEGRSGELFIPQACAARVADIALALIQERDIEIKLIGTRPGEKVHEVLVSEEEAKRTVRRNGYFVVLPMLPELARDDSGSALMTKAYSSGDQIMSVEDTARMLSKHHLMLTRFAVEPAEMLR